MARTDTPGVFFNAPPINGEAARLIRARGWTATSLGASERWPSSLHNYLNMILELPTAAIIFWGPDHIQLYNDGYAVIMGPRHPEYLGAPFRDCWPETYDTIHPWMQRVLDSGETVEVNRTLVPLTRYGFTEESYFTFSFSPLRDDERRIAGVLQIVTEVTAAVLAERRASALHELSNQTALARTTQDAARLATQVLGRCTPDLPFSLMYFVDPDDQHSFVLSGSTGFAGTHGPFPLRIDLQDPAAPVPELARAVRERKPVSIEGLAAALRGSLAGTWPTLPARAVATPIAASDQQSIVAVLVAGISPRLELDDHYRTFLQLAAAQLANLVAAARAYDEERKRAEALAAVDRAKTEFFGNISHEFRTPLTLILGPLEDALLEPSRALSGEPLAAVHRNALRLLRLVNTLLEFTRAEADRLQARYEPTDLPMVTAGLAGAFQSLIESAGLRLRIDCPRSDEPAYVDRTHWERIVLNLVSNAFKFTFDGEIAVRLHRADAHFELAVEDTGIGIPEHELSKIFERFHRVKDARGRSFEGSGIGLALVRELVQQHGGTVDVTSASGRGSTFRVRIPRGDAHIPKEHGGNGAAHEASLASSFVAEAEDWLRPLGAPPDEPHAPPAARRSNARVLIADDNPDMREYLMRLLSQRWRVDVVADGQAALDAALAAPPDLVLSDVMMPNLDGVALVKALRAHPSTSTVPVILLSARAGEEAVVGGLETGADDYLIKPFSARELIGRVGTHLEMAALRRRAVEAAQELAETRSVLLQDLDRKNRELESFTYSVSHDLRGPIRAIEGFSTAVLEDHGGELGLDGKNSLERVIAAARRMSQLIDDLLLLSRIERQAVARTSVDLSAVARQVLADLAAVDRTRQVEIAIADSMSAFADRGLMQIVLDNLLGNAWKFTARTPGARIELGSARTDRTDEPAYFVRDNGAGFDAANASRLFMPFQRYHGEREFSGTGVGLATVRRIVERHGGRIWVESSVGAGTTVYWTLPEPVHAPDRRWTMLPTNVATSS
ncbi:MAG TPA: ATP-binding protein [Kofleriaceae bacterium]|nr:ATP-binding protein [Kofleriaceae bacterium]